MSRPPAFVAKLRPRLPAVITALGLLAVAALVLVPVLAEGRPGGGQSYGGGGGGGGGGSGGGGEGDILVLLIWLAVEHPVVGLPLLLIVVVGWIAAKRKGSQVSDWDSGTAGFAAGAGVQGSSFARPRPKGGDLQRVRSVDRDFSQVLFEDFVYRLYATAHEARSDAKKLAELAPYLEPEVRSSLAARQPTGVPIANVVVGALRVLRVELPSPAAAPGQPGQAPSNPQSGEPEVEVELEFEANVTAGDQGYYLWERWVLRRPTSVRTPSPEKARSLSCPNCGAPFQSADNQRCDYCGEVVTTGLFDWRVVSIRELRSQPRPPALSSDTAEAGTHLPTVYDPNFAEDFRQLLADDPQLQPQQLEQRLNLIYRELNRAWTARDLKPARAFLSDGMADYLRYWIEAYLREGLINKLDEMRITALEPVKVVRDRWYDAITYRVHATGRDYTVRADNGELVSGDAQRERPYSEYWTLIRGAGTRGPARGEPSCPNCGAPLAISMGGECEHCSAHVTAGEFDWVLSKIEQDEAYAG